METETSKREKAKLYYKKYYADNKDKTKKQITVCCTKSRERNILKKLNEHQYVRIPYNVMEKHNIIFDSTTKKYVIVKRETL